MRYATTRFLRHGGKLTYNVPFKIYTVHSQAARIDVIFT